MNKVEIIRQNTVEIIPEDELINKLNSGKQLRVKWGIDPTAPDVHLGNAVCLRKLREFQELGHKVILIVGDFTAKIGDPSGKSIKRPQISDADIDKNMTNYIPQILKILIPDLTEFRYNSEWLGKLTSEQIIKLAARFTVAQVLEREDISNRYKKGEPVALHELLYALFQGYDSVAVHADIEIGATEQKFNILFGREVQREFGHPLQVVITLPILEGLDGVRKMSKSYNNYIGITESPREMFGKLMSIPDSSIINYIRLTTNINENEISDIESQLKEGKVNPRDIKIKLAREVIAIYHSNEEAIEAEEEFIQVFSKREVPTDIPVYVSHEKKVWIVKLLVDAGIVATRSEVRRLIEQGGIEIDGQVVKDVNFELENDAIIKIGKHKFLKFNMK
ncbi:MAG: tyrosine--tRNA ligase [Candidatus Stahlbacteria bacterium]|nr:tyrosine--tRNA ligase [Candidatus Stahlbacteria bacterium]